MKYLVVIFLFVLAASPVFANPFSGGDGSPENPYQIRTLEELEAVSDFSDKHFIQKANIRKPLTEPLCTKKPFTGSYNGNGYLINLAIEDTTLQDVALFSEVRGDAVLKNIVTTGYIKNAGRRTASIAMWIHSDGKAEVSNCVNMAEVIVLDKDADNKIGGSAAGIVFGISRGSATINNNLNIGSVRGKEQGASGIIGSTGLSLREGEEQKITNNINAGFIQLDTININEYSINNASGIVVWQFLPASRIRICNNLNVGVIRGLTPEIKVYGISRR